MSHRLVTIVPSLVAICLATTANPAHAQLLIIEDLFNQLTLLEVQVTLNGQAITNNSNSIISLEADVSALNANVVQIQADLDANSALDVLQSGQIASLDGRVTGVETQTGINTGAIATLDVRLDANDALDVVQDTQIAAIDVRVSNVETQTGINTGAITTLGARLDINDLRDVAQDVLLNDHEQRLDGHDVQLASLNNGLAANNARDDGQDVQLASLNSGLAANNARDDGQDVQLASLNSGLAANNARDDGQDVQLASLNSGLAANDARDDGQDARLDGHDTELASLDQRLTVNDQRDDAQALLLVEHDARIWTAQGTADAAAADAANLRSAVVAGQIGLVQQASYSAPITVGASTGGDYVSFAGQVGDRRLGGVAAGVNANDAVNLSQMQLADAAVLDQARAYTDTSLANFGLDLDRLSQVIQYNERELRQEIEAASAGAAALAGLPQAFQPGKGMVAIGMGGRGSSTAFAIGVGKAFNSPSTPVLRAGAAIDARRGDITYNAAVGFHF